MKGQFEMYSDGARLTKVMGTRWIGHKICAMGHVKKSKGRAML